MKYRVKTELNGKILKDKERKINMGFCSILTLILVVLKAFSVITCSWWICFLPIIISIALKLIIALILFFIALIAG